MSPQLTRDDGYRYCFLEVRYKHQSETTTHGNQHIGVMMILFG